MTFKPATKMPIAKVWSGALASVLSVVALWAIRRYVWPELPADVEGPLRLFLDSTAIGLATLAAGYLTPFFPGEVVGEPEPEAQP